MSIYVLVNGLGKWGTILLGCVGGGMVSGCELHELTLKTADTDQIHTYVFLSAGTILARDPKWALKIPTHHPPYRGVVGIATKPRKRIKSVSSVGARACTCQRRCSLTGTWGVIRGTGLSWALIIASPFLQIYIKRSGA